MLIPSGVTVNQTLDNTRSANNEALPEAALLAARDLSRWEGNHCLVERINLELQPGDVLGLLGLNGAGKTTTLNLLAGVLSASDGDVSVCGHSIRDERIRATASIGYLPEQPPLYMDMRVRAYLDFCGRLRGLRAHALREATTQALEACDLQSVSKRVIRNLSKGFRQRIGLAQAILHQPKVLLLDEPSSGLDPQQMQELHALIRERSTDSGIVFSSHVLSEVTAVCNRIAVIHHGRIVHQQSLDNSIGLSADPKGTCTLTVRLKEMINATRLTQLAGVLRATPLPGQRWQLDVMHREAEKLPGHIINDGLHLLELKSDQPSLEILFNSLVQGESIAPDSAAHDATQAVTALETTRAEPIIKKSSDRKTANDIEAVD